MNCSTGCAVAGIYGHGRSSTAEDMIVLSEFSLGLLHLCMVAGVGASMSLKATLLEALENLFS